MKFIQIIIRRRYFKKVIIDLAIPADIDAKVIESNDVHYIDIESLKNKQIIY